LEWSVDDESPLGVLTGQGARIESISATDGRARYEIEVPSEAAARRLLDDLDARFEGIRMTAKRERSQPAGESAVLPADGLADLTDRQQEALEAAYRAGYFEWPRDSTAEDVADSLDISASTLHSHLRKAEGSLFAELFEDSTRGN
jgi:predicted DNA binding protein